MQLDDDSFSGSVPLCNYALSALITFCAIRPEKSWMPEARSYGSLPSSNCRKMKDEKLLHKRACWMNQDSADVALLQVALCRRTVNSVFTDIDHHLQIKTHGSGMSFTA
ncbi:hypothetical protein NM688_g7150 [Phlebia brevispora]|uniref:Uncharacterized protein n=1 Tax=Phlebia brevispora TaxID=194682 RepID=A0ACC1S8P3_9APHY|nr:hypothetical protein NM688_g7150 [Phlebia brevispora]